ncbi:MAG: NUDIX hydrolase [Clostridia bacterium]|jgi:ADP-ribose pyrophosphatase|nr:NUDIX hydrolase [Clostridia bacterium]MCI2000299.1 NUDIX hydrolase [Clostridia bacterium]MCI2015479.1 NUDIX hydrolase [Clostridia bacterium]
MYETVESELKYKGRVLDVYQDKVMMPNGRIAKRENIVRGLAAAIIPVDEDENMYFVRQYRHAADKLVLEIPAGMLEKDEEPKIAAARELEEETGFKAGKLTYICNTYMDIGICTSKVYFYIAEKLKTGKQHLDIDEFIEIEKYSVDEAVKMIFDGKIEDAKTMAGILACKQFIQNKNEQNK